MSSLHVREVFLSKYARQYNIPIEYHVTAEISRLLSAGMVSPSRMDSSDGVTLATQHRGTLSEYSDYPRQLLDYNFSQYVQEKDERRSLLLLFSVRTTSGTTFRQMRRFCRIFRQ